ncbi:hypothetical protein [Sphingomonas sanguinis]|nr:hypothetical protein [Sphingomonas sanguinis]
MFSGNKDKYVLFGLANHERKNVELCVAVAPFFHSIGLQVMATGGI